MNFETITLEVSEHIAAITLNRPEKLNAFSVQMMRDLIAAFDNTDADDNVRCVIVTGAGRTFCAGADLSEGKETFGHKRYDDPLRRDLRHGDLLRDTAGMVALRIYESLKPVIAAFNGAAVGAGATVFLPADIRIASNDARFGYVFSRRGIAPEGMSTWFLPRIVGVSTALDWCISGRLVDAEEARSCGLIRSIHDKEELLDAAGAIATDIVKNVAPVSAAVTRQMIWRLLSIPHPMYAHRVDSRAIQALGSAEDAKEGVMSFLEKRPPQFRGKVSSDFPDIWPEWNAPEFK